MDAKVTGKIMDQSPIFPCFGYQLSSVLQALDKDLILDPVWTLKQTSGKIFLDICWTKIKTSTSGANHGANTEANCVAQLQSDKQVEPQQRPTAASARRETNAKPALHLKKKKKKSPSTRKRDKERLVKWLAAKRLNSDSNSNIAVSNLPITRSSTPQSSSAASDDADSASDNAFPHPVEHVKVTVDQDEHEHVEEPCEDITYTSQTHATELPSVSTANTCLAEPPVSTFYQRVTPGSDHSHRMAWWNKRLSKGRETFRKWKEQHYQLQD